MFYDLVALCKGKKVWIQTHNFPDPDAIASAYGLQELLEHFDVHAELCHDGEIDKLSSTKMLEKLETTLYSSEDIKGRMSEKDAIILVDCQKNSGNTTDFIGDEIAAIDHHPTFVEIEYLYKDLRICGACSSMIAQYFEELELEPSVKTATALVYGLRMDTLQFSRGVTEFDIKMYSFLFPYASQRLLRQLETNNMEFSDLKAYASAIDHIAVYGKVGFSYLDFACPDALVAILSDFLLSLDEVEVVVLYNKRRDGFKFSLRSERSDVHAGELAREGLGDWGNGGGHAGMAGGYVPRSSLPTEEDLFYAAVQDRFTELIRRKYPEAL